MSYPKYQNDKPKCIHLLAEKETKARMVFNLNTVKKNEKKFTSVHRKQTREKKTTTNVQIGDSLRFSAVVRNLDPFSYYHDVALIYWVTVEH